MIRALTLALCLLASPALAHKAPSGWEYDKECCDGRDCAPRPVGFIQVVPGGFLVVPTGKFYPVGDPKIRVSGDAEFHWCGYLPNSRYPGDPGIDYCLYVPPGGV